MSSCGSVDVPWRGFTLLWTEITPGTGESVADAACTIEAAERESDGTTTLWLDCSWGLSASGSAIILWPWTAEPLSADFGSGARVELSGADTRALRLTKEDGALLFAGRDGQRLDDWPFVADLDLAVEPSDCPPVAGNCFAENFLGQLRVREDGESPEVLCPFQGDQLGDYRIQTGALVLSNADSFYECDGEGDDLVQVTVSRAY